MSHVWMSHVTHMKASCHTYEWVMSHICMSHVTHMNESCHTYEWVVSHIWMSHVTHKNESCHTYECVMTNMYISLVTQINESYHVCTCAFGVSCLRLSNFMYEYESCGTSQSVISCIYVCVCVCLSVRVCVWVCLVTHINESCGTCRRFMRDMSIRHVTSSHRYQCVHMYMCSVPHSQVESDFPTCTIIHNL